MNPPKISFGFNKKIENKNLKASINKRGFSDDLQKSENSDPVKINDINDIHRNRNLKETKVYSIPALENSRDGFFSKIKRLSEKAKSNIEDTPAKPMSLDEIAAKELCEESINQHKDLGDTIKTTLNIPVNDLVEGELGEISSSGDYEEMPISSFGEALLHGLGSAKGEGLGKKRKVVAMVEPANRSFGLSLSKEGQKNNEGEDKDEIVVKPGCNIIITGGRNKGKYGTVEFVDIDHCIVKLARDQAVVRVVEQHIKGVTPVEFKDLSRVINQEMYDEFKNKEKIDKNIEKTDDKYSNDKQETNSNSRKVRDEQQESTDDVISKYKSSSSWLTEGLRVKIIGKSFRKSRHYKEKVVIKSMDDKDRCTCQTDDKKFVKDVYDKDLETIIPRHPSTSVLIVKGSSKGQKGFVTENDKERQEVKIEIKGRSIWKGYDDVCEYLQR